MKFCKFPETKTKFFTARDKRLKINPFENQKVAKNGKNDEKTCFFPTHPVDRNFYQNLTRMFLKSLSEVLNSKNSFMWNFDTFSSAWFIWTEKGYKIGQKRVKMTCFFPTHPVDRNFYQNLTRMFLESLSEVLNSKNLFMWHFDAFSSACCIFTKKLPKLG